MLVKDNVCLNVLIEKIYYTMDHIEKNKHITNNFHYPWTKGNGLDTKEELNENYAYQK